MIEQLDEVDKKIINELKQNSRISMTEMGKKVFLTSQAAKNRLERLQDMGVVQRYTVNLNCPVFGYTVHGIFILNGEKDKVEDFKHFVHETDFHILHCYELKGHSFMIDAHFPTVEEEKRFYEVLSVFGKAYLHPVVEEVHGVHPVDE